MNRKEALKKELDLKSKLRSAIQNNDNNAKEKIRGELLKTRKVIKGVTAQEAYGQMSY